MNAHLEAFGARFGCRPHPAVPTPKRARAYRPVNLTKRAEILAAINASDAINSAVRKLIAARGWQVLL
jgi:hypothetical protein